MARTEAGRFTLSPLGPGEHELWAELPARGVVRVGAFEIGSQARHDVGELRLAPAGAVRVRRADAAPLVRAWLVAADEQRFELREERGGELVRGELAAGEYRLIVETTTGTAESALSVRSGETTRVETGS